jgi:cell division protein FtsZ
VNRDFNDVCAVMRDSGTAVVSVAKASGEKRLFKAMQEALNYPLLPSVEKKQVKRLLYIVYNGEKNPARIQELTDINKFMEGFSEDIEVLWGHYPDETLDDEIKVSIIATGFDDRTVSTAEKKDEHMHLGKLYEEYYGRLGSADTNTITNNVPQQPKVEERADEESSCSAVESDMIEEDKDAEPEQKGSVWSNMVKMMTVFMSE